MPKTVNVLVAVNVAKAEPVGEELGNYVFMVDTTGRSGDGNEGGDELVTTCENGDTIRWHAHSIDPSQTVAITGFDGDIESELQLNPAQEPGYDGAVWSGIVRAAGNHVQYSMYLLLNGKTPKSFDPYITATNPARAER